jgi:hypothetical protein
MAMPGTFFYIVRRRASAVPGTARVLLDPPPGSQGATDGHTIGILMPSDRVPADGEGALVTRPFPDRRPEGPPRA